MFNQLIEGLSKILGPISTLSKDRRELKDSALRAISNALDETYLYYRFLDEGHARDVEREGLLSKYWSAAAIPIRHFDPILAETCDFKSEYWINPDRFDERRVKELGIALNDVREAYRAMLRHSPKRFKLGWY